MLQQIILHALNRQLRQDEWARSQLKQHSGKSITVNAAVLHFNILLSAEGLLENGDDCPPALSFNVPLHALSALPGGADAVAKHVQISGDAHLAECFSLVFKNLNWDFEEELAKKIGDIPARRLHAVMKTLFTWHKQAAVNLAANIHEYVQEEKQWLIKSTELHAVTHSLNVMHNRLDRLEERITKLSA